MSLRRLIPARWKHRGQGALIGWGAGIAFALAVLWPKACYSDTPNAPEAPEQGVRWQMDIQNATWVAIDTKRGTVAGYGTDAKEVAFIRAQMEESFTVVDITPEEAQTLKAFNRIVMRAKTAAAKVQA